MTTHHTYCALRLGDNLIHLHFLRKLAGVYRDHQFIHFAHLAYMRELVEMVCDIPNVKICDLESSSDRSIGMWEMKPFPRFHSVDAWKNADGIWENSLFKNDFAVFYISFFRGLAEKIGLVSPIVSPADLLFDYPALKLWNFPRFDCLIVNSQPLSGQMPEYAPVALENLVGQLARKYQCVTTAPTRFDGIPCTQAKNLSVSQIGALSRFCRYIVMVSTGPSWPTLNVYTAISCELRVILIGSERLNYSPNTEHAQTADEARTILQRRGLL